eukprot:1185441-Prorocentrum_minimum.AAC.3
MGLLHYFRSFATRLTHSVRHTKSACICRGGEGIAPCRTVFSNVRRASSLTRCMERPAVSNKVATTTSYIQLAVYRSSTKDIACWQTTASQGQGDELEYQAHRLREWVLKRPS